MTTPAISPVDPPGAWEVVNHDHDGAVTPGRVRGQLVHQAPDREDAMIRYSPRMIQPWNRMVTFTPITAIATTSRQITVATTQVSGLSLVWPGAIRLQHGRADQRDVANVGGERRHQHEDADREPDDRRQPARHPLHRRGGRRLPGVQPVEGDRAAEHRRARDQQGQRRAQPGGADQRGHGQRGGGGRGHVGDGRDPVTAKSDGPLAQPLR